MSKNYGRFEKKETIKKNFVEGSKPKTCASTLL